MIRYQLARIVGEYKMRISEATKGTGLSPTLMTLHNEKDSAEGKFGSHRADLYPI